VPPVFKAFPTLPPSTPPGYPALDTFHVRTLVLPLVAVTLRSSVPSEFFGLTVAFSLRALPGLTLPVAEAESVLRAGQVDLTVAFTLHGLPWRALLVLVAEAVTTLASTMPLGLLGVAVSLSLRGLLVTSPTSTVPRLALAFSLDSPPSRMGMLPVFEAVTTLKSNTSPCSRAAAATSLD